MKLAAWLDRSAHLEYKDASDIATVLYWYGSSTEIQERLYDTTSGQDVPLEEGLDDTAAAARLPGIDIADVIGDSRRAELTVRRPGSQEDHLYSRMTVTNAPNWTPSRSRRWHLVAAMERGLGLST